jgi:predicted transposase/invertase (TIGR01784 family)
LQRQALLEGEKRGKAEGRIEGKLEGKAEVARTALGEGLDIDMVCKITGLSRETIMKLKKALEN